VAYENTVTVKSEPEEAKEGFAKLKKIDTKGVARGAEGPPSNQNVVSDF